MIDLGDKVKDVITGFDGIAIAKIEYIEDAFKRYKKYLRLPVKEKKDYYKHFYDCYHNYIKCIDEQNRIYEFSIQTHDSPEGDVWWHGKFQVIKRNKIEIIEQRYGESFYK